MRLRQAREVPKAPRMDGERQCQGSKFKPPLWDSRADAGTHHSAELLTQSDGQILEQKGAGVVLLVTLSAHLPTHPPGKPGTGPNGQVPSLL